MGFVGIQVCGAAAVAEEVEDARGLARTAAPRRCYWFDIHVYYW